MSLHGLSGIITLVILLLSSLLLCLKGVCTCIKVFGQKIMNSSQFPVGRAPGRKRKAVAADLDSSSSTLPKQTKTGDSAGQVNAGNAGGSDVTAATTKPSKKRGRPPKPKPDTLATASRVGPPTKPDSPTKAKVGRPKKSSSPTKGKVGRPRKQTEADSQNNVDAAAEKPGEAQGEPSAEAETLGSSRGAKARVAPLKVRDSGKGKGKK